MVSPMLSLSLSFSQNFRRCEVEMGLYNYFILIAFAFIKDELGLGGGIVAITDQRGRNVRARGTIFKVSKNKNKKGVR